MNLPHTYVFSSPGDQEERIPMNAVRCLVPNPIFLFLRNLYAFLSEQLLKAVAPFAALLLVTCETAVEPLPPITSIVVVSGNNQTGPAGQQLVEPMVVRVVTSTGRGVRDIPVAWSANAGTLSANSTTTNEQGITSVYWTVGTVMGANRDSLRAIVTGLNGAPVTFVANVTAAATAQVSGVSGSGQTDTIGHTLVEPLAVRVADVYGNPVGGASVSWRVTSGGGVLSAAATITDDRGYASVNWTLGFVVGLNRDTAVATVSGLSPVTFLASAVAEVSKLFVSQQPTIGIDGRAFDPTPSVALVNNSGGPVPQDSVEVFVELVDSSSGRLIGPRTAQTDRGRATFTGLAITGTGPFQLRFRSADAEVVSDLVTVVAVSIVLDSTTTRLVSDSVELENGIYRFALAGSPPPIDSGTIIAGIQGLGFLRRVEHVASREGSLILATTPATLEDVGAFGKFLEAPLTAAISVGDQSIELDMMEFTAGSIKLFENLDAAAVEISNFHLVFVPRIETDWQLSDPCCGIEHLNTVVGGPISMRGKINLQLLGSVPLSSDTVALADLFRVPVKVVYIVTPIGILPVMVSARISLEVLAELTATPAPFPGLTGDLNTSGSALLGATYTPDAGLQLQAEFPTTFELANLTVSEPSVGAELRVVPRLRVDLLLSGILGPYAYVGLRGKIKGTLDFDPARFQVTCTGALAAGMGVGVQFFGRQLVPPLTLEDVFYETEFCRREFSLKRLAFVQQPSVTPAGATLGRVIVGIKDALGNTDPNASDSVTLSLVGGPPGARLLGTLTVAAEQGLAIFDDLVIDRSAVGYTLAARASGLLSTTSEAFAVGAPLDRIVITPSLIDLWPGSSHQFVATVLDSDGNSVAGREFIWSGSDQTLATVNAATGEVSVSEELHYGRRVIVRVTADGLNDSAEVSISHWMQKAPLAVPRSGLGLGVIGTQIYAIGGFGSVPQTKSVEVYDPATNRWTARAPTELARHEAEVGVIGGKLYVAGGVYTAPLSALEAYDPNVDVWSFRTPMPITRHAYGAAAVNNLFYAIGGYDGGSTRSVVAYSPSTNTWTLRDSTPSARAATAAASQDGLIYVFGGYDLNGNPLATAEVYDPAQNSWRTLPPMPTPRAHAAATSAGGELFVLGGFNVKIVLGGPSPETGIVSTVEAYNPATNAWTTKPSMPTPRYWLRAATVGDTVYAVGGFNSTGAKTVNEAYRP